MDITDIRPYGLAYFGRSLSHHDKKKDTAPRLFLTWLPGEDERHTDLPPEFPPFRPDEIVRIPAGLLPDTPVFGLPDAGCQTHAGRSWMA